MIASEGRQGAVSFYFDCTSESSGGSGVRGRERRRRSGSRESKQRASVNAQGHAGHDGLNQRQGAVSTHRDWSPECVCAAAEWFEFVQPGGASVWLFWGKWPRGGGVLIAREGARIMRGNAGNNSI